MLNRVIPIICTLIACAAFVLAWQWIVVFEPSNPAVPLGLCFLSGFAFRHAFMRLDD